MIFVFVKLCKIDPAYERITYESIAYEFIHERKIKESYIISKLF